MSGAGAPTRRPSRNSAVPPDPVRGGRRRSAHVAQRLGPDDLLDAAGPDVVHEPGYD